MEKMNKRVQFFVRVLPDERTHKDIFDVDNDRKILWHSAQKSGRIGEEVLKFETDGIFTDDCQLDIYETVIGKELSRHIVGGTDVVLLAFGQQKTGKTISLFGMRDQYHYRGIIPRVVEDLFVMRKKFDFTIRISALMFSGQRILDLLDPSTPKVDCRKCTGTPVSKTDKAMELLFLAGVKSMEAEKKYKIGSAVVTIFIESEGKQSYSRNIQKIHLVDLDDTEGPWAQLTDRYRSPPTPTNAQATQNPILKQKNWAFLAEKSVKKQLKSRLAYRNSAMVGFIWEALSRGKVRLFGHIKRGEEFRTYTLATLKYGCNLTGKPPTLCQRTVTSRLTAVIGALKGEVLRLRDELVLTDILENQTIPITAPHFNEELLNDLIEKYLNSSDMEDPVQLLRTANPLTILPAFKLMFRRCLHKLKSMHKMDPEMESETNVVGRVARMRKNITIKGDSPEANNTDNAAKIEEARMNWNLLWKEFLSRHPYWHQALASAGKDMASVKTDKEIEENNIKEILVEIQNHSIEVDRATWERQKDIGDKVGQDGLYVVTREEKFALKKKAILDDKYKTAIENLSLIQKHYIQVASRFTNLHDQANRLFTEYVYTTYEILILPDSESYDLTVPLLGPDLSQRPIMSEGEENFLQLQTKHLYKGKTRKNSSKWI